MENAISNIAVISFPRTASRSLVHYLSEKYNKIPAHGVLHYPEYLGKNDYDIENIVYGCKHILHGHWHSLDKLNPDIYNFVKKNYTIVTSHREMDLVKKSIIQITGKDLFDDVYKKSIVEKRKWDISEHYIMSGHNAYIIQKPDSMSTLV